MEDSYDWAKYLYTEALLSQYLHRSKDYKLIKWLVMKFVERLIRYGWYQINDNSICRDWSFNQIIYLEGLKSKEVMLPEQIKEVEDSIASA